MITAIEDQKEAAVTKNRECKSAEALAAEAILDGVSEEVREAIESMRRTTRVRRVYNTEERELRYIHND